MKPTACCGSALPRPTTVDENCPAVDHEDNADAHPARSVHPVFTVGSALRWLGHDCPGRRCWQPIDTLSASVWFLLRGQQLYAFPPKTRVLVSLPATGADLSWAHQVISDVNWCARRDAIEVSSQASTRGGRPVPSLTPVSVLQHYRPARLDEAADPTEVDLADLAKAITW